MEIWKSVVGFEGRYEVSSEGRIASLRFRGNGDRRVLKSTKNYAGYHVVALGRAQHRVHCVVLAAFVGPRPEGMQGCHGDNNRDNNALSNLRWDTPSGNCSDRRSYQGDANPNAKLTEDQRRAITTRRLAGERPKDLAVEFGITAPRVCQLAQAQISLGSEQ